MRKFVLALILVLSVSATAQIITPATSVAVSVLRLLMDLGSGRQEYIQVDVVSEGGTLEQARLEGFRTAIGQAIGSVVATQTASQHQRLVRDEIISYSSGFVDKYEILEQTQPGNRVRLKMRVWVAKSKLAQRLLSKGFDTQMVPGDQLAAQAQTLAEERQQGDQLARAVMQDYPHRAFDVQVDQSRMQFDDSRRVSLDVPIKVSWNPNFINAVNEVRERTRDPAKDYLMYAIAVRAQPSIKISAIDASGKTITQTCQEFTVSPESAGYNRPARYLLSMRNNQIFMDNRYSVASTFRLDFSANPWVIEHISRIQVEIVSNNVCHKY